MSRLPLEKVMTRRAVNGALFVAPGRDLYVVEPNGDLDRVIDPGDVEATETLVLGYTTEEGATEVTYPLSSSIDGRFLDAWYPAGTICDLWSPQDPDRCVRWVIGTTVGDGTGDVIGPASAVNNRLVAFDGTTGKIVKDGGVIVDTDDTLAADSDARVPTQAAVKAYVDAEVDGVGAIHVTHAWVIGGEIKVPAGTTDSIGAWVASVLSGTTARIIRAHYFIVGGTSATFKLQLGGVDIPGLTGLAATTTPDDATPTTGTDGDLADLDQVKVIVTAVSGTPVVLTIAMTVEYTP